MKEDKIIARKKVYIVIILAVILTIVIIFMVSANKGNKDEVLSNVNLEEAENIALKAAKDHPDVEFSPHSTSVANFDSPSAPDQFSIHNDFKEYHFVYVWSELRHIYNEPFAISKKGNVFKLPEEFNELVADRNLHLENEEEAIDLLEFYLVFNITKPALDKHLLIENTSDIPGIENDNKYNVEAMNVTSEPNKWIFDFFTWQYVGGTLFDWEVSINNLGEVQVKKKEEIERSLGEYAMIE